MNVLLLGVNHRTAPLEVRERLVYPRGEAATAVQQLKNGGSLGQVMLLSTCNRTEVYAVAEETEPAAARIRELVFAPKIEDRGYVYQQRDRQAIEHLYRVACGLDSLVVGEAQILGQVRDAYELSRASAATGAVLHRLLSGALRVGKRARRETEIGAGAVSVASIAVELSEKVFGELSGRRVLLIGAGENGEVCAQHLLGKKIASLTIANRTREKAEALATHLGGEVVAFDALAEAMGDVDVVVSTTGAPEAVINAKMVREAMRKRDQTALVLLDIAVPRDVDPEVDAIPNVFRFDLDALQEIAAKNLEHRAAEIPRVEALVQAEVDSFVAWWGSLHAGPVIRDLHRAFEEVRAHEVERNAKRFAPDDREQLDIFSRNLVRKLLMGVSQEIKGYRRDHPAELERLAALRQVFHLGAADAAPGGDDDDDET